LAPRELPRFPATIRPADSLPRLPALMSSDWTLGSTHATGPPRFLNQSFGARRPQPPRQARWLLLVSFTTGIRLHHLRKLGRLQLASRGRIRFASLQLTPSPPEASTTGLLLRRRSFGYTCERAIHMTDSFHSARLTRLNLAHQRRKDAKNPGSELLIPLRLCVDFGRVQGKEKGDAQAHPRQNRFRGEIT